MEGLVIGLDLNDDYSQISCNEKEKSWTVPTVICRRKEKETWLIGEEAYAATLLGEGVIVDKLLKMVRKEGTSTIGGICYTGTDLLKIFLKKLLDCPFKEFHTDQVEQLVITMHGTDAKVTEVENAIKDGSLHVFDTSAFTVNGSSLEDLIAEGGDYAKYADYVSDGYYHESELASAPSFDIIIDGITSVTN